jgi:glyoxylase-like metal-dependent hydrolase (beta-lactamase superfamily II)
MIFGETGSPGGGVYVTGLSWSPVYLLDGDPPILFEAGFHAAQRLYERDIKQILKEREPAFLFLSHLHWDHCGSVAHLKRVFQDLKVVASKRAEEILRRQSAISRIRELSEKVSPYLQRIEGLEKELLVTTPFEAFEIDLVAGEGVIDVGGLEVQVFYTPGHTRDMLSYYVPDRRILFATESCGVMDRRGRCIPQFLVDYDLYVESCLRLSRLPVDILCPGHHFVFTSSDVKAFFERSMEATREFKEKVVALLEQFSFEETIRRIKAEEYDSNPYVKQAEEAYLLNLTERVRWFAERRKEGKEWKEACL